MQRHEKSEQLAVAGAWVPVLRYELEAGQPRKLLVLGGKAFDALKHRQRHLPPGDPVHQRKRKQSVLRASQV